jgi:AraC-like DNA-binding protein
MGVVNRPAIVRGFLKSLHAIDLEHIRSIFRELIAHDQRPELKDATCPAPLVRGEEDGFVPSSCVEELHYGLTDSQVVQLPAQMADLSRMHFAKQFRAATGYRPHDYLLYRRIESAKATLSSTDMPLAEIALNRRIPGSGALLDRLRTSHRRNRGALAVFRHPQPQLPETLDRPRSI